MTPNQKAFLDAIAWSEIGPDMLAKSDNGYNVLVGNTLFDSYADHPRILVRLGPSLFSTAAGRYQLLVRYYDAYTHMLRLTGFSPDVQDTIAIQQIRECRALPLIEAGDFDGAVNKCKHIWASLPGAGYGQRENTLSDVRMAYVNAGGKLA